MDKSPDLADLVQALRMLMWRSSRFVKDCGEDGWRILVVMDWRRPASLEDVANLLRDRQPDIAAEWSFLATAFASGPRMPDVDDLLRRYVRGEIGDRTVKWVMDWDHWQLIDECVARGLPPMQMGEDWDG
jgi:hypothetical protein